MKNQCVFSNKLVAFSGILILILIAGRKKNICEVLAIHSDKLDNMLLLVHNYVHNVCILYTFMDKSRRYTITICTASATRTSQVFDIGRI